jgi:hypothetical protein
MAIKNYRFHRILVTNSETRYKAQYRKDGQDYIATNIKTAIVQSTHKVLERGIEPYKIIFAPRQMESIITIDTSNPQQVDFINLIKEDPEVKTRKKLEGSFRFELIDDEEEINMGVIDIKSRTTVSNIILSMPLKDLKDVCYFFNFDIVGLPKSAIISKLLHPTMGCMWSNVMMGGAFIDPRDLVINKGFGEDYNIKSTVNKAILLKIIKLNDNNTYVFGDNGVILGATIDNVYAYFKSNKAMFESSLMVAVSAVDKFNEDIDFTEDLNVVKENLEDLTKNDGNIDILGRSPEWSEKERLAMEQWYKDLVKAKGRSVAGNVDAFKNDTLKGKIESLIRME